MDTHNISVSLFFQFDSSIAAGEMQEEEKEEEEELEIGMSIHRLYIT